MSTSRWYRELRDDDVWFSHVPISSLLMLSFPSLPLLWLFAAAYLFMIALLACAWLAVMSRSKHCSYPEAELVMKDENYLIICLVSQLAGR